MCNAIKENFLFRSSIDYVSAIVSGVIGNPVRALQR